MQTYVVGTHLKRLVEALLMSTHNICFHGEIRKILCGYSLLSVAMHLLASTDGVQHASCSKQKEKRTKLSTDIGPSDLYNQEELEMCV